MNTTPTISEAARRAAEQEIDEFEYRRRITQPRRPFEAGHYVQQALDSAHPAPKEGGTPVTEPEKCNVCGGDEPCSHDFDKIGWPIPAAPSLQSVAEGAAQKVSDLTDEMAADGTAWFVSKEYKEQIAAIIARHFAPLLTAREAETRDWIKWHGALQEQLQDAQAQIAERDERIGRLEEAREDALQALGEHPESETDLAQRIREIRQEGRDLFHDITALRTRCEELERDKARLDWLCENPIHDISFGHFPQSIMFNGECFVSLRAAIDTARKEGQP